MRVNLFPGHEVPAGEVDPPKRHFGEVVVGAIGSVEAEYYGANPLNAPADLPPSFRLKRAVKLGSTWYFAG